GDSMRGGLPVLPVVPAAKAPIHGLCESCKSCDMVPRDVLNLVLHTVVGTTLGVVLRHELAGIEARQVRLVDKAVFLRVWLIRDSPPAPIIVIGAVDIYLHTGWSSHVMRVLIQGGISGTCRAVRPGFCDPAKHAPWRYLCNNVVFHCPVDNAGVPINAHTAAAKNTHCALEILNRDGVPLVKCDVEIDCENNWQIILAYALKIRICGFRVSYAACSPTHSIGVASPAILPHEASFNPSGI